MGVCFESGSIHHGKQLEHGSRYSFTIYYDAPNGPNAARKLVKRTTEEFKQLQAKADVARLRAQEAGLLRVGKRLGQEAAASRPAS